MNTSGIHLHTRVRWLRNTVELFSSMRFAISALVMVAFSSVIGTVLKQNEPFTNYVNQFGAFWFEVFKALGLYNVYTAWWFLLVMTLLLLSTTLCVVRNTPKMIHEMRSYREKVRINGLRALPQHTEFIVTSSIQSVVERLRTLLGQHGFKIRLDQRERAVLIAAKSGSGSRYGYILAHSAIVVICIGGLLDSGLPVKLQVWLFDKQPIRTSALIREIPASGRLSANNPTFRGNALIAEGQSTDLAIVSYDDGSLLQPLPFEIELKKFNIEYYTTGMPKLFASDVLVTDKETGKKFPATIKVNQPLIYKNIAVYQSSFDDGGSHLRLKGYPMRGAADYTFVLKGDVGSSVTLERGGNEQQTVELTSFRTINVENLATAKADPKTEAHRERFREQVASVLSSAASATKSSQEKQLKNVGPSVQYKVRDKTGQAREYHNYMLPVELDGRVYYLTGVRERPGESFQFLRIPADANGSVMEFMRVRAALSNRALRAQAASRFAEEALHDDSRPQSATPAAKEQLRQSAQRMLDLFTDVGDQSAQGVMQSGFDRMAHFILQNIKAEEQEAAARLLMKILSDSSWHAWQLARIQAGLPRLERNEKNLDFLQSALTAVSDSYLYGAPVYLQLESFDEVKASVFQLTRSPGKGAVYLGSLLLVLGIFAMFYIRERRVWAAVSTNPDGTHVVVLAMSMTRKTLDFAQQFATLVNHARAVLLPADAKVQTAPQVESSKE